MADAGTKRSCAIWSIRGETNRWIFAEVDCIAFCSPDTEGGRSWFILMSGMSIFYSHPSLPGQAPIDHQRCAPQSVAPMPDSRMLVKPRRVGVGDIYGGGRKFMRHFDRHFYITNGELPSEFKSGHIKRINPKFATESKFYYIYMCVCVCVWLYFL